MAKLKGELLWVQHNVLWKNPFPPRPRISPHSIHLSIPGKEARGSTAADEQVTSFPRTHQVDLSPWLCNLTALYFAHLLQTAIRLVANRLSEHVRYNIRLQSVPSRWQSRRRDVRNRDLIYGLPFAAPACCCMTCIMLRSC